MNSAGDASGDPIDQILRAILIAAALRAVRTLKATGSQGLAEAARELAQTLPGQMPIAQRAELEFYQMQCRRCLWQGQPLDVPTTALLCAMGAIAYADPRHQTLFNQLMATNDVPARLEHLVEDEMGV